VTEYNLVDIGITEEEMGAVNSFAYERAKNFAKEQESTKAPKVTYALKIIKHGQVEISEMEIDARLLV
jgi:hypothetical protein